MELPDIDFDEIPHGHSFILIHQREFVQIMVIREEEYEHITPCWPE